MTGNPLYPLHLAAFGRVWLRGWYGPEAMSLSHYYVPVMDWRALVDTLLAVVDPRLAPVWLAAITGAWAVGRERANSPACDRLVWAASGAGGGERGTLLAGDPVPNPAAVHVSRPSVWRRSRWRGPSTGTARSEQWASSSSPSTCSRRRPGRSQVVSRPGI